MVDLDGGYDLNTRYVYSRVEGGAAAGPGVMYVHDVGNNLIAYVE